MSDHFDTDFMSLQYLLVMQLVGSWKYWEGMYNTGPAKLQLKQHHFRESKVDQRYFC